MYCVPKEQFFEKRNHVKNVPKIQNRILGTTCIYTISHSKIKV